MAQPIRKLFATLEAKRSPANRISPRLLRLIALYDRAQAECQRFDVEVEMPARRACGAALAALPTEPEPPHEESFTTFVNVFGDTVRLSTENAGTTGVARRMMREPSWAETGDENWRQAHREIAAAADRRDALLAEQAVRRKALEEETRRPFRIKDLAARSGSLADRSYRLWSATLATPAGSLADAVVKLGFIERTTEPAEIDGSVFAVISADLRRLAGEA